METTYNKSYYSFKESGNQLFKKTSGDGNLSPVVYQLRMCQALQFYNKASNLATSDLQRSSIRKNMAVTQLRIAERLYARSRSKQTRRSGQQLKKQLEFFLEEGLKSFSEAVEIGQRVQSPDWTFQMREKQRECAELYFSFLSDSNSTDDQFPALCGRLHHFCWNLSDGSIRAQLFLKLGRLTFNKAVQYQEADRTVDSLQLLHDNYLNIEEAKKLGAQLEEAVELEESNFMHLSIGDSVLARRHVFLFRLWSLEKAKPFFAKPNLDIYLDLI